jgi:hypothetical protein
MLSPLALVPVCSSRARAFLLFTGEPFLSCFEGILVFLWRFSRPASSVPGALRVWL